MFESDYVADAAWNVLETVGSVADEVDATHSQVSLRWLMDHERFTCVPIIGARTVDQLDENFDAVDVSLSDRQWARIDAAVDTCSDFTPRPRVELTARGGSKEYSSQSRYFTPSLGQNRVVNRRGKTSGRGAHSTAADCFLNIGGLWIVSPSSANRWIRSVLILTETRAPGSNCFSPGTCATTSSSPSMSR